MSTNPSNLSLWTAASSWQVCGVAPKGCSKGPGGCTYEHLKILLDDTDTTELLMSVCNTLAQGKIPANIKSALMGVRLTALSKPLGGVHRQDTGQTVHGRIRSGMCSFPVRSVDQNRPLTASVICCAQPRTQTPESQSYQSTGSERTITAMLGRLASMPGARSLLPFVRMSYAQPSSYQWFDDQGGAHVVTQAEGGEQGDPLVPLLFSTGIQGALEEVAASLLPGEQLCAFLDDVYLLFDPSRVRFLYDLLVSALARVAGIQLHQGEDESLEQSRSHPRQHR